MNFASLRENCKLLILLLNMTGLQAGQSGLLIRYDNRPSARRCGSELRDLPGLPTPSPFREQSQNIQWHSVVLALPSKEDEEMKRQSTYWARLPGREVRHLWQYTRNYYSLSVCGLMAPAESPQSKGRKCLNCERALAK